MGLGSFRRRSHDAVIRVYDEAGNVIETHEHKGICDATVSHGIYRGVTNVTLQDNFPLSFDLSSGSAAVAIIGIFGPFVCSRKTFFLASAN
jgi:hypothetical protein